MVFLQLKKIRSLVIAGALEYDNFVSLLRLQEGAFKLSVSESSLLAEVEKTNINWFLVYKWLFCYASIVNVD